MDMDDPGEHGPAGLELSVLATHEYAIASARLQMVWPYWRRLVRLAMSWGARRHDAEDLASATCLRAATSSRMRDDVTPWPYLAASLRNALRDERRRAARKVLVDYHELNSMAGSHVHEDDTLTYLVARLVLQRLVATESPSTVAMIARYCLGGLTWAELGEEFNVSASAARSQVSRALSRLRTWLQRPSGTSRQLS